MDAHALEDSKFFRGAVAKKRHDNLKAVDMRFRLLEWMKAWEPKDCAMLFYFGHGVYDEEKNMPCI